MKFLIFRFVRFTFLNFHHLIAETASPGPEVSVPTLGSWKYDDLICKIQKTKFSKYKFSFSYLFGSGSNLSAFLTSNSDSAPQNTPMDTFRGLLKCFFMSKTSRMTLGFFETCCLSKIWISAQDLGPWGG